MSFFIAAKEWHFRIGDYKKGVVTANKYGTVISKNVSKIFWELKKLALG